jgi:segregation and condensation protein B
MDELELRSILEGILFVSESPIKLKTLVEILPGANKEFIEQGLQRIKSEYGDSRKGLELVEVAGGYQFRTKPHLAEYISRLKKAKPVKFSPSAMETLAIVAYRQPVIRPEIERIRGVDCGWTLRALLEKGLVRMMGRKDLPGRPIIYGTSQAFLELFGLNSLEDLPTLKEIQPPPGMEELEKVEQEVRGEESEYSADAQIEAEAGGKERAEGDGPSETNEGANLNGEASSVEEGMERIPPEDKVA